MDLSTFRDLMIPLPPLVAAVICLSFALLILLTGSSRTIGYSWILLFGAAWNLGVFCLFHISDRALAFLTIKLVYASIIWLIAATYMQLAPRIDRRLPRQRIVVLLASFATVLALLPGTAFIDSVQEIAYTSRIVHFYGVPGAYYWSFLAYLSAVLFLTVVQVSRTSVDELSSRLLLHLRYLYGSSGLVLLIALNDILPYLSVDKYPNTNVPIYPFGSVAAITWPGFIYYAELKYGLLSLPSSAHKAVRYIILPSLLMICIVYGLGTGLEYLDRPALFLSALTTLVFLVVICGILGLRRWSQRSDSTLFANVSDLSFHLVRDLERGGELQECIHTILRNFSRVGSSTSTYFLSFSETSQGANVYSLSSNGQLIETFLPSFDISRIPFGEGRASLARAFDFPRKAVLALQQFLPNTNDSNLWLRHYCSGQILGITTFTLSQNRLGLAFSDEVTLALVARQIGFTLHSASCVSAMISQNRELDTCNSILRSENVSLSGTGHPARAARNNFADEQDQVTTVLAHDLKNLASLLQIDVNRLREGRWSINDQVVPVLDRLRDDLKFITEVANDMTLFASPGALLNSPDRASIRQILNAALKRYERCSDEEISVGYICSVDLHSPRRFLELILLNLIDNASKSVHLSKGSMIWTEVSCSESDLRIRVCDDGQGLTDRQLKRLFHPSLRFPESTSDSRLSQGSGLGLAIVCRLVKEAGGRVSAISTPGVGSVFEVTIPLVALRLQTGRSNAPFSL